MSPTSYTLCNMIGSKGAIVFLTFIAFLQLGLTGKSGRGKISAPAAAPAGAPPASSTPEVPGSAASTPVAGSGSGSAASSVPGSSSESTGSIKGTASYYTEWSSNPGSCGFIPGKDELIAAVNSQYMPAKCNQCIQVNYEGKSIKVKVTDTCPACDSTKLDLSNTAFAQLAPLDKGILQITWSWVPC